MVYNTSNSGLPHNCIWNLAVDAQGNIWAATGGGGLAKFDGANWTVYNTSNSELPFSHVYSLAFDAQENLWIGTAYGLAVHHEGGVILPFAPDTTTAVTPFSKSLETWG